MSELYTKQQSLLHLISRSLDNFKKIGKRNYTPAKIRSRIQALKDVWAQCLQGHAALCQVVTADQRESLDYFKQDHFDAIYDTYQVTLDFMTECLEELEPGVSPNCADTKHNQSRDSATSFSLSHLPPINIPPFSGQFDDWESFRDRFKSLIINNPELSAFARMHFLSSSLTGRALESIRNIPITADNFEIAWNTLLSRFDNKRRLVEVHISALYDLPSVTRESASEINHLRDKTNRAIASLRNLERSPEDILNDMLVFSVTQKLDMATRKAWKLKNGENNRIPTYDDLNQFLSARARALEELTPLNVHKNSRLQKLSHATATNVTAVSCSLCHLAHFINKCPLFLKRSPSQRLEVIKQANRCINCLSKKHALHACPSKYTCRSCNKRHHTLLHVDSESFVSAQTPAEETSTKMTNHLHSIASTSVDVFSTTNQIASRSNVMLATARVSVRGPSGRVCTVRALLDQGSEITFISENLRQTLKLRRMKLPISISAVGGIAVGTCQYAAQLEILPRDEFYPALSVTASILKSLTKYSPLRVSSCGGWNHISNLTLADPDPMNSDPIDVIFGADVYGDVLLDGIRKGNRGQPIAQNTIFGWILSGPISSQANSPTNLTVQHCATLISLETELRRFWEVEEVPRPHLFTPEEQRCEAHFVATHSRTSEGRYIVRLPFKRGPPIEIGESRRMAERFLNNLHRRFHSNPDLKKEYGAFLQEYEQLGHMKRAIVDDTDVSQHVYIPHHPVIRESSVTTHLRVVFHASSLTTNSTSLNDHLLESPKLHNDVTAVLLRWRQYRYVLSADIAKMYRQILLDSRDINYQRILWARDETEQPEEFQLLTVTYGTASAPFLALRVLQQLVEDEGHAFPLAISVLQENMYVDDVLFGADDIPLLGQIRDQVCSLLQRGFFELRKWSSNTTSLLKDVADHSHGLACTKTLHKDEQVKVLGVIWNPVRDSFQFSVKYQDSIPKTKRSILATIARFFDPLGWGTPVTITAKILLQQLWIQKLNWDDVLPSHVLNRWVSIHSSLPALEDIQIDRWIKCGSDTLHRELHGFADASNVAYAAAIYMRVTSFSGEVTTSLLVGKSKVAPVKVLSVPRLELSAAVLLSRLLTFVISSLNLFSLPCFCWTDSTIVLAWLNQHPARWKTFVANRVAEVQSRIPQAIWRHVPTADNPADCASRGILGHQLSDHHLWWQGPIWLRCNQSEWPLQLSPSTTTMEENQSATVQIVYSDETWDLAKRYSSWPKLIKVTAYILRFVDRVRDSSRIHTEPIADACSLSREEIQKAKNFWIKAVQAEVFPREREALLKEQSLPSKGSISALNPFLDNVGLIRVGGRLMNARLPMQVKHPILLAPHPIVRLIVHHAHLRSLHAGVQFTLATLRHEFWILRARSMVKSIIFQCVVCTRERATTATQLMGHLPSVRITPAARAFLHCGVDYAGPILVRPVSGRGISSRKTYISLWVCMTTRAIHLELVEGYSTAAFLAAYARFCARRGFPESIYSDNGTTFVGADRELTQAFRSALRNADFQNSTAFDKVSWHFIPPSSPHFGGLWEAGVRSVKHHIRRVVGAHTLTFEEMTTLLCNVEAALNSRPLSPLTDTLDDYEPLTPGHFLIGSALTAIPEPSVLNINENRLSRWQVIRQMHERFWKLWTNDYVNTLQQRVKWRQRSHNPFHSGQLVLIKNSTLPPCKWELGRVTECHTGNDGLVRVVTVKTAKAEYRRPITKLCQLPIDIEQAEFDDKKHELR